MNPILSLCRFRQQTPIALAILGVALGLFAMPNQASVACEPVPDAVPSAPLPIPLRPISPHVVTDSLLSGTAWRLVTWRQNGVIRPQIPQATITVSFSGDRIQGSGGCNQFSGDYRLMGRYLSIGEMISTMRGCETPVMTQESDLLTAIAGGQTVGVVTTGELHLTYKADIYAGVLIFEPMGNL